VLARRFPQNISCQFGGAVIRESLAAILQQHNRLPEARVMLQDSIVVLRKLLPNDSMKDIVRFVLHHHYANLADVLHGIGDEKAAADVVLQAEKLDASDTSPAAKMVRP